MEKSDSNKAFGVVTVGGRLAWIGNGCRLTLGQFMD